MKKIILFVITTILLTSTICLAQTTNIQFKWNKNVQSDIAGYALYQSTTSNSYNYNAPVEIIAPELDSVIIANLENGTYYWVLRAFDNKNRYSDNSAEIVTEINYDACPSAPTGFMVVRIERK